MGFNMTGGTRRFAITFSKGARLAFRILKNLIVAGAAAKVSWLRTVQSGCKQG